MQNILKVMFDDLEVKEYPIIQDVNSSMDMDSEFSIHKADKTKNKTYSVIIVNKSIGNKTIKLLSPKLNMDSDNLKIKLYMKGFVEIRHSKDYDSYNFILDFF